MTPTDAVFDTNILFSGTGWRGSPYSCLQLARLVSALQPFGVDRVKLAGA